MKEAVKRHGRGQIPSALKETRGSFTTSRKEQQFTQLSARLGKGLNQQGYGERDCIRKEGVAPHPSEPADTLLPSHTFLSPQHLPTAPENQD